MEKFAINGGKKLYGEISLQSAKNSVLPLIAASIMNEGKTFIEKCPRIYDVLVMMKIIVKLGGKAYFVGDDLVIDPADVNTWELPCDLTREIRASLFTVGALMSRFGYASICAPGGCNIGERPIDIHIDALRRLGVRTYEGETVVFKKNVGLDGKVRLRFPSVGATENIMMAAAVGDGRCVIENAAKEPEIVELQNFLNLLGAKISGAGTGVITVEGVSALSHKEVRYRPIADRIEGGTFLLATLACGGEVGFKGQSIPISSDLIKILDNNACKIYIKNGKIEHIRVSERPKGFGKIVAAPYPAFPSDLQPQLCAAACVADGVTVIEDKVFSKRFGYARELGKTGASIDVYDGLCV
ncbi:MAG: UDP-N-acetylglucosamine 1-carboxyvinyltransferase, partial [Clostridia bacterium]|nr:UDP-N-acetylglucosamine 1-carboxyvinyltransferase [Clostridia bacterium]